MKFDQWYLGNTSWGRRPVRGSSNNPNNAAPICYSIAGVYTLLPTFCTEEQFERMIDGATEMTADEVKDWLAEERQMVLGMTPEEKKAARDAILAHRQVHRD